MTSVNFSNTDMAAAPDHALGYDRRPGRTVHVPHENIVPVGPAGSINAHLLDMCRWVAFQMGGGKIRSKTPHRQAKRFAKSTRRRSPFANRPGMTNCSTPDTRSAGASSLIGGTGDLTHTGCMDGFNASASFLPGQSVGVVVLTNVTASPLIRAIPYCIFDCLLGLEPVDWNRRFRAEERQKLASRPQRARGLRNARAPAINSPTTPAATTIRPMAPSSYRRPAKAG